MSKQKDHPDSQTSRVDIPTIKENKKVDTVNNVPKDEALKAYDKKPGADRKGPAVKQDAPKPKGM